MPTITQDLAAIRKAIYGQEVRESIADGIEKCYAIIARALGEHGEDIDQIIDVIKQNSMSENTIAGWGDNPTYVPARGEIVLYTDAESIVDGEGNRHFYPDIKIGDGSVPVVDLPFVTDAARIAIGDMLTSHVQDEVRHITQQEREFWNAKLNYDVLDNDTLELNRN